MAYTNAEYRMQNTILRARLAKALGNQFLFLNLRDLDGSWSAYYPAATDAVSAAAEEARLRALNNFRIWLYDEVGEVMAERLLAQSVAIDINDVAAMLRLKGPIEIKRLIANGWRPEDAWLSAMRQSINVSKGYIHAIGQRSAVSAFAEYPHVLQGWRRSIGPNACSFCRALERTVWHPSAQWEKPHDGCGCTAHPVANDARVRKYLTPVERARNETLRRNIAGRIAREAQELAALSAA